MPRAYYNEIDPYCADWLRNLIAQNIIAPGDVDERPIQDVRPVDLNGYTQCHFFAGLGGWSYALREAAWPDDREVWTGSCPCQPFSAAGKRGGFADERHLWPYWQYLVEQRRPPIVFGEQVASAAVWLQLVRGDLEALDYAVGCCPVEAASAGADHLRDRFWFVADHADAREGRRGLQRSSEGEGASAFWAPDQPSGSSDFFNGRLADARGGRRAGPGEGQDQFEGRTQTFGTGSRVGQADADKPRPQGQFFLSERSDQWAARPDGVAHTDFLERGVGDQQPAGQLPQQQQHPQARDGGPAGFNLGNSGGTGAGRHSSSSTRTQEAGESQGFADGRCGNATLAPDSATDFEWVIGADGKARRVKPGVRLLAHGIPNRISKLRAFGNAIDPRPAAAFIKATCEALNIR